MALLSGCLDGDESDDSDDGSTDDPSGDPEAVYWRAEVFGKSRNDGPPVYPSDHERLETFDPLLTVLDAVDSADDPQPGDRFDSGPVPYLSDRRPELDDAWERITAETDGVVYVEHDGLHLRLERLRLFDD